MFIVIMPHSWGKGETIEEADKKARSEGGHGRKKTDRRVYEYDPKKTPTVYVSEYGSFCWQGEKPVKIDDTTQKKVA